MDYKLFGDFITLQALLKDLGIIPSGGAIKGFLAQEIVLFNGQDEKRRGKKIRIGDVVELPNQGITIKIAKPTAEEINQHLEEKAEKERVAALVKSLNKENKKKSRPQRQDDSKLKKPAIRFPGT